MSKIPRKQFHFSKQSNTSTHIHENIMLDLISEFLQKHSLTKTLQTLQNERLQKSVDCSMKQEKQMIVKEDILALKNDGFKIVKNREDEEQKCEKEQNVEKTEKLINEKVEEAPQTTENTKVEKEKESSKLTQTKIKSLLNANKSINQILIAFQNPSTITQESQSSSEAPQNPCKLLRIFQTSSSQPQKKIKLPISLKSTILVSPSIKQILIGSGKLCFAINENNYVETVDIDHCKVISKWSKHGMNEMISACCFGQNCLLVGYGDGSLLKLSGNKEVQVEYEIRDLHKDEITAIFSDSKRILTMSSENKLKIISTQDRSQRKTKIIQNFTFMFQIECPHYSNAVVGVDRFRNKLILYDIDNELSSTIFTTPYLISQVCPYKQSILIGIQQQNPCIYQFNLKTFDLTLRIQLKTINKRDINFTVLNSSDTLVLVIGTKKIYYYNTKTWKLFHKITSIESTRKYKCIHASKDDKIVVVADEKTIEIYDCDEDM